MNALTTYLLLLVKKPHEALEFARVSQRIAQKLLDESSDTNMGSNEDGTRGVGKQSQITGMLLSNYLLGVNLMLSIAEKYNRSQSVFEVFHAEQLSELKDVEEKLKKHFAENEAQGSANALSYLVEQHKKEILDENHDYTTTIDLSFNKEFQNMILVCVFVPFLHEETPKPTNVQKVPYTKDNDTLINQSLVAAFDLRQKIIESQDKRKYVNQKLLPNDSGDDTSHLKVPDSFTHKFEATDSRSISPASAIRVQSHQKERRIQDYAFLAQSTTYPRYNPTLNWSTRENTREDKSRNVQTLPHSFESSQMSWTKQQALPSINQSPAYYGRPESLEEKSIWRHGAKLRTRYNNFEVDRTLVSKHKQCLQEHDLKIKDMLENGNNCGW